MTTPLPILDMLDYDRWATLRVLDAAEALPDGAKAKPEYQKILDKLAHNVGARESWFARVANDDSLAPKGSIFAEGHTAADIRGRLAAIDHEWREALLAEPPREGFEPAHVLEYASFDGKSHRSSVAEILLHVHGHGLYHRGQCGSLLVALGGESPSTDFIVFARDRRAV